MCPVVSGMEEQEEYGRGRGKGEEGEGEGGGRRGSWRGAGGGGIIQALLQHPLGFPKGKFNSQCLNVGCFLVLLFFG